MSKVTKGSDGPGGRKMMTIERPRNIGKTMLRIFSYMGGSKFLIILIVAALIISSVVNIAGSLFLQPLINDYIIPGDFQGLKSALLILVVIYLIGIAASFIQTITTVKLAQKTINVIRRDLFSKMQTMPLKYYDTHTHGELMSRYTNDADNIQIMLEQSLTQLISSVLIFVGAVLGMLYLNPILFIITFIVLAIMFYVIKNFGRKSQTFHKSRQKILGELNGNIEEAIGGLKEIKAFNHEAVIQAKFEEINEDFKEASIKANFLASVIMPIMINLNNVSYAFSAIFGGILTVMGKFTIGGLASYLQFSRQIGQPINQISNQLNNVYSAIAGAERIFELMDTEPEIDEGTVELVATEENGCKKWYWVQEDGTRIEVKGDVRFHGIHFSYEDDKPVLKNLSLYAKPGQMIAFVGSTGAGKTTITNLINRFYDVQQGTITYDSIDVKNIKKESLRRSLGMVLQDTHLFTDTVMNNIRYGNLNATDEECIIAAKKANAHSFISRLPEGYNTLLKGDGSNLSQGQRQLLSIARAYISDPPVMILDEATSSIDTRTEQLIQKGMDELMKGRTVFVIAHRLSTIKSAKAIIVLENGEIIERGDHNDLIEQKGRYYQLYTGAAVLG